MEDLADLNNRFGIPCQTQDSHCQWEPRQVFCLGQWSRLFECHRPSLTDLNLSCFHLGVTSVIRFNWSDAVAHLWPNLSQVGIYSNLVTMQQINSITQQLMKFHHLKKYVIPLKLRRDGCLSPLDEIKRIGSTLLAGLSIQTCEGNSLLMSCRYQ